MKILIRSSRTLCDIYSRLICHLSIVTRSYYCASSASRRFNGTLHSPLTTTLACRQPFFSLTCSWSSFPNNRRNWPFGKGKTLHWLPARSKSFSENRRSVETEPTSDSRDKNMEPYFEGSYAKLGTSSCKKCKEKIEKGALRLAKVRYRCERCLILVSLLVKHLQLIVYPEGHRPFY